MSQTKPGAIEISPRSGNPTLPMRANGSPEAERGGPGYRTSRLNWRFIASSVLIVSLVAVGGFAMFQPGSKRADGFAEDRPTAAKPVPFDAKRAMGYLETLCKIGPRMSGTEGMKKQQEMMEKHFTDLGGKVAYQRFNSGKQTHLRQQNIDMANMIVSWNPDRLRRVILCSHYDTRPTPTKSRTRACGRNRSSAPMTAAPASPCSWS